MRFRFLGSFDRSVKKLPPGRRERVLRVVRSLLDFFETGTRADGVGLKKLRGNYWEIRSDLETRSLLILDKDGLTFVIAGNHDEIRRFLKRI